MSRRSAIALPVLGAGAVLLGESAAQADVAALDAYTELRTRWCEILTGASTVDPAAPEFAAALQRMDKGADATLALIDRGAGRTRVFTDLPLAQTGDSGPVATTHTRLESLAIAWYTPGSKHHQSAAVLADILAGLDTANRVVYYAGRAEFDNWYDWEIGASKALANCLVLLEGRIPSTAKARYAAAIRHFVPDPWYMYIDDRKKLSTGANRVDLCQAALVEGIAGGSSTRIARAAAGLPAVCAYVESGDGFYADGSFIQHANVAYTGTYGLVLLGGMANLLALLRGTAWEPTDPAVANLLGAVESAWARVIHNGRTMSMVNGRAIARTGYSELAYGHSTAAAILRLAQGADAAQAARWRAIVRGWYDRSGARKPYDGAGVARTALISALLSDPTVTAAPEPDAGWVFRNMARAVHRRRGWAFGIAMACDRIARYESLSSGENLKGFHTGAGMTYLYDDDPTQYSDGFWPTVDPYRLAGTTVDRRTIDDRGGRSLPTAKWAGGAVLDGAYSAVGMTLQAAMTDLTAKKSWFCFDEYVVAMGAGITSTSGYRVDTYLENRNLHASGTNRLIVNGVEVVPGLNTSQTWTDAQWAHIEGVGGYIFPNPRPLRAHRYERTGSYRDINTSGETTPITRRYLTLSQDHGIDPTEASYFYIVAPKATVERTAELYAHRNVTIVNNNTKVQTVRQSSTGITMTNIWYAAGATTGSVTANRACSVVVREKDGRLTVAVADPNRAGGVIRVGVAAAYAGYRLVSKDSTVTVVAVGATIVLDVRPSVFGRTMAATFAR
ncbi:MAG: polysaccharide lyase 8 family protein [Hamadaea sp.]|nr:polysaccharide lyase 8 family protein [Hamadaea sp.]